MSFLPFVSVSATASVSHPRIRYSFGILHRVAADDTIKDRIVEEAPEPSDIIWEHVGQSKWSRLRLEAVSYLFSGVVVVISFLILKALSLSEPAKTVDTGGSYVRDTNAM